MYNKVGFENALFYLYDPNLFKWYREVQGSFEIKNTRGSINYDDIASPEEFVETWADQYIDEIQKLQKNPEDIETKELIKKMDETIDFIATDYPQFDKEEFYQLIKDMS